MQFTKIAFLASIAALASAQSVTIEDLPTCALGPAVNAIGTTGCSPTDIACVCKNTSFLAQLTPLIKAACSAADFTKAVSVAAELCAENGVTITPPTASSSAPAVVSAPATSATASTSAVATTAVVSTTTSSLAVVTTSTPPKNGTISTSALPSVVTANAAAGHGTWAAAGLLGVGAVLAAF